MSFERRRALGGVRAVEGVFGGGKRSFCQWEASVDELCSVGCFLGALGPAGAEGFVVLCMCGRPVNNKHLGYLHVDITYSQFIFIFSALIYIYVACEPFHVRVRLILLNSTELSRSVHFAN